jgi:D-serine deaminase-like pyridoxal phosphate-dependent protein
MAIVVDVLSPVEVSGTIDGTTTSVTVVTGGTTPVATSNTTTSVIELVQPGGTVANVSWGVEFPIAPVENQIFIKLEP